MKETKIFNDFYQFNSSSSFVPITFNQYLLLGEEPLLVHTGSIDQTKMLIPKLKDLLGYQTLSYIFVSHFESDECGGLDYLMKHFPDAKTICSPITARQLKGFGFTNELIIKNPNETFKTNDYLLKFIGYPAEMHLWEGLLLMEMQRGIFFSSDLFIRMGNAHDEIVDSNWKDEVESITTQHIPSQAAFEELQDTLMPLPVNYVALGHGPFLKMYPSMA
jgi:flavorubredoxin